MRKNATSGSPVHLGIENKKTIPEGDFADEVSVLKSDT